MKTIFQTRDGKQFEDKLEAEKHEATLVDLLKVKQEASELISKLSIILKDVSPLKRTYNDDGEKVLGTYVRYDDENYENITVESEEEIELAALKEVVEILNKNLGNSSYIITQYYNSNCY